MSVYGAMRASISGMAVQSDRLGSIADNVANVGTTGYKRSSTEFSTLVIQSGGQEYESGAVETNTRRYISEQGSFNYTSSVTDLAINGDGFFVVERRPGEIFLSRAGAFVPDRDGVLVNSAGGRLMGYNLVTGNDGVVVNGAAGLEPVNTRSLAMRAVPSREGAIKANLPADVAVVASANLPSANSTLSAYSVRTSLVSYDNLGREVTLDFLFAKSGPDSWELAVFDRATAPGDGGFPYSAGPLVSINMEFDGQTGQFTSTSPTEALVPMPNGATIAVDLGGTTQFAADFAVIDAGIDGTAPEPVNRIEISAEGVLTAVYENGARVDTYRIPLARVNSPDNMVVISGNLFAASLGSGDMQISTAGQGGAGTFVTGALEQSTVDIAGELTAMIEAQRSYTANSRVFQTGAELTDVLVNLRS